MSRILVALALALALLAAAQMVVAQTVPNAISYQGKLTNPSGQPVSDGTYQVQFKLYTDPVEDPEFWTSAPQAVATVGGLFTTSIQPIWAADLAGKTDVWLEVWVALPPNPLAALSPRVKLASVPFAMRAADLALPFSASVSSSSPAIYVENSSGIPVWFVTPSSSSSDAFWATSYGTGRAGWFGSWNPSSLYPALQVNQAGHEPGLVVYGGSGLAGDFYGTVQMSGFKLTQSTAEGYVLSSDSAGVGRWRPPYAGADRWSLTGNAGTVSGTSFLGTTDNQPMEIRANNSRALVLQYAFRSTPMWTYGMNVLGGHNTNYIWGGVISGAIGGGGSEVYNWISGDHYYYGNTVSDDFGTVAGGSYNTAGNCDLFGSTSNASYATVGGGYNNRATGTASTIPGGYQNTANGGYSFAAGRRAWARYNGCFVWGDSTDAEIASTGDNQFVARASGGTWFWSNSAATTGVVLAFGSGSWSNACDRALKENFTPVEPEQVLNRLAKMPVQTWNYKSQDRSVRHIGPTAQDFASAFNVGEDDKHISSVDADGVALAAVQALYRKVREKDAKIADLQRQIDELRSIVVSRVSSTRPRRR